VKIEGSRHVGERAILLAGTADPRFIARHEQLLKEVEVVVRDLVCEDTAEDYVLTWRVYGANGVRMTPVKQNAVPEEAFILANASRRPARAPRRWCGPRSNIFCITAMKTDCRRAAIWRFHSRCRKSPSARLTASTSII
jgi:hypothetical protein